MEILKPSIINIQGRCYRVNPLQRPPGWEEPEENEDDYHGMYVTRGRGNLLDVKKQDDMCVFQERGEGYPIVCHNLGF